MSHSFSSAGARRRGKRVALAAAAAAVAVALAACGSSSSSSSSASSGSSTPAASGGKVGVALILKTFANPFFVAMKDQANAEAAKIGVSLTVSAGKQDGDVPTQVTAIENAISAGNKGILITPNGPGVNSAIEKARKAGLYVCLLYTSDAADE